MCERQTGYGRMLMLLEGIIHLKDKTLSTTPLCTHRISINKTPLEGF